MPYLKYLHTWLMKVGAKMPSVAMPSRLAAPVHRRIDHDMVQRNEVPHEI